MSLYDYIETILPGDVVAIWHSIHSVWIETNTNRRPFIINCEYSAEAIARTVADFKIRWPGKPVVRMKHYTERRRKHEQGPQTPPIPQAETISIAPCGT